MIPESIAQIAHEINRQLPGSAAQYRMAPGNRAGAEVNLNPPDDARLAAVLILFYPVLSPRSDTETNRPAQPGTRLHIPMMIRPARTGPHSGQISFPGGAHESVDENLQETALRESQEEMGIHPANVHVLGTLSKIFVPPSGYLVTPYVGWSEARPNFVADPGEVEQILEIPVNHLLEPGNRKSEERDTKWGRTQIPFFAFQQNGTNATEHKIWGASAMILSELLTILDGLDAQ